MAGGGQSGGRRSETSHDRERVTQAFDDMLRKHSRLNDCDLISSTTAAAGPSWLPALAWLSRLRALLAAVAMGVSSAGRYRSLFEAGSLNA